MKIMSLFTINARRFLGIFPLRTAVSLKKSEIHIIKKRLALFPDANSTIFSYVYLSFGKLVNSHPVFWMIGNICLICRDTRISLNNVSSRQQRVMVHCITYKYPANICLYLVPCCCSYFIHNTKQTIIASLFQESLRDFCFLYSRYSPLVCCI